MLARLALGNVRKSLADFSVYFLTVIGVFLFLSVQSLEKRRWSE